MKKILHVSSSPRGQASESYRLSRNIVSHLQRNQPGAMVVERMLAGGALSPIDENYAMSQAATMDISLEGSMTQSEELIRELEEADFVVVGTPMHNFTIPATLKAWIDYVVRARRTFDLTMRGKVGTLRDRPVFVAIASGGKFSGERARQPDFLTPYLKAVLGVIGLHDVTFFSIQGTAATPDVVTQARARTHRQLEEHFASSPGQAAR